MKLKRYEGRFIRELKQFPHEKASFGQLADSLGPEWTKERVEEVARRFSASDDTPINVVRHGVQYFGCETGAKPGLYKEIRRGIENRWDKDNAKRHMSVVHTSRTALKGQGQWSQPDLVGQVHRRADASPHIVYLAIEVERRAGFGIQSIYQAYELGRGADFSWVFYEGPACSGPKWAQISVAAKDLGVGVVHASKPTQPSGWKTMIEARTRRHSKAQLDDFLMRSGITRDMFERPK